MHRSNPYSETSCHATPTPDVVVLGGGLSGRLIAWRLARTGHHVALYEQGAPSGYYGAAWVAAAMLAPLAEAASAERFLVELGAASLERWAEWLPQLPQPVFFQRNGTLIVWHAADRSEWLLFEQRVRKNAPITMLHDGIVVLHGAQVTRAEPTLGTRFHDACLLANEGQLDNRQLLLALASALDELRVDTHWHTCVREDAMPTAGLIIDCRGLGAKCAWSNLRGVRGEVARVYAPGISLSRPARLLHPRYPLYVAPKQDNHYVIGATEIESEDMSPVSVRSTLELLSAAYSLHPAFGEARILELNSHCRPTLPDHCPALSWDGALTLRVNGLYRHGYMIAPEIARETIALADALLNTRVRDIDDFNTWRTDSRWPKLYHTAKPD
ncbi:FAD-dependent oxidoreductase [Candidatus Vallotia tarda]|uniref:Thiamine biosynthesis oxidoreductase ThiO n=1 Tax=Candidatus Vallotiella hemipterorum TaxID=1177213 RepID=A0A916JU81_9BURK|nr:FAD-dependent oxidoreductase [Candidatus Vallotia tarda]CAG7603383.1 Putative thiamine biosynthesis oxidoreductase ThiO [Candidatus Vallotia tarda]